ncbi:FAD binding domain-containing protein [Nonomuraea sp. NPDC046802]|uniref:FAD binding domain-containing protein n=1 Tax=Nonomuraea sp. NPDC046802 TaxID=3154919 RepID=UPI0033CC04F2
MGGRTVIAYHRAQSLAEALGLLAEHPDRITPLAGGQSLLPALRAGRTTAATLLDIGHLAELRHLEDRGDTIAIGAATRHHELAGSELLAARAPALRAAAAAIADPQVRHMGTIGGSLANADPAADLAVAGLALDAQAVIEGPRGRRTAGLDALRLEAGELVVEVLVPVPSGAWSYQKFSRNALDWAIVGVVAVMSDPGGPARVALSGMGPAVVRAPAVEEALARGLGAHAAAELADDGTTPPSDPRADPDYRRHLARVLVRRALEEIGVPA